MREKLSGFGDVARPDLAARARPAFTQLGQWTGAGQLPLVYHSQYNIRFWGLEKLHPFDSTKFVKVQDGLVATQLVDLKQFVAPAEVTMEALREVHTEEYLHTLHTSKAKVARVMELPEFALQLLPNSVVQRDLVRPLRYHTAGTMLAAGLALEHGWAINLGGGQHHAYWEDASDGGWCLYSDLTLAMYKVRHATGGEIKRMLLIDLDVHQGNGHERDKLHFRDEDLHILDGYNCAIWPNDIVAKEAIGTPLLYKSGCKDTEYLPALETALRDAFAASKPQLVLYNAGTDLLDGDPLGGCCISAEGVIKRDEMVFEAALQHKAPIVMVLSGGYARNGHLVITKSIANLLRKFDLMGKKGSVTAS